MILDKLDKLAAREKWGLGLACLILFGLLVDRAIVQTVADRFSELSLEERNLRQQLEYANRVAAQKEAAHGAYEAVGDMLGTSPSDAEAIDELKGQLDLMAGESGLAVVSMKHLEPRPRGSRGSLREYVVDIGEFEGDMHSLLTFLHRVRSAPGLMKVSRVTVSPATRDEFPLKGSVLVTKIMKVGSMRETEESVPEVAIALPAELR